MRTKEPAVMTETKVRKIAKEVVDKEVNTLGVIMKAGFDRMDAGFKRMDERFERLERRVDNLETNVEKLSTDMKAVKENLNNLNGRMKKVEEKLEID